ncbi:glutamate receptor ionotropic, delta-2-like [Procambarus clarkii]|uniref:glutamate receptor ionotropic, delta-2-like n=1 Tax=Procambarus clarkii TaxID=6728 RepID=UPI003743B0A9
MAALVSFLLAKISSLRQIVIVYDESFPGVTETVRWGFSSWADTTIIRYDAFTTHLQTSLSVVDRVAGVRTVVVLCLPENTSTLMAAVRQRSWESTTIHWLIILEKDITQIIQDSLREGSQVSMAVRRDEGGYTILSFFIHVDNSVRFRVAGRWVDQGETGQRGYVVGAVFPDLDLLYRDKGATGQRGYVVGAVFPDLDLLYRDFQGRQLTVATVNNWPFFQLTVLADGRREPLAGIDVNVVNTLSEHLNFTYQVVEPADRRWGGPGQDGSVSGMVGVVYRHQAHLALGELTITEQRASVVDFTNPYFMESTTLVSRAPAEKNRSFAVFYPFTLKLWALVITVTFVMGPVGYLVQWGHEQVTEPGVTTPPPATVSSTPLHTHTFSSTEILRRNGWRGASLRPSLLQEAAASFRRSSTPSLQNYSFNIFRSLVLQGNFISGSGWPVRLVLFSWFTFCVIVYALYAGTLTAYLTKPTFEKPIDSLQELLEAADKGVVPAVQAGTSNEQLLKSAESGVLQGLWRAMDPSRSFPANGQEAMLKVLTEDVVYMTASLNAEIRATQRGRRRFHLARQTFSPQGYGLACTTGSPFRHTFEALLGRMVQAGLVNKWVNDEMNKLRRKSSQVEVETQDVITRALSLTHIQGAFIILVSGFLVSTTVFLLEYRRRSTVDFTTTVY